MRLFAVIALVTVLGASTASADVTGYWWLRIINENMGPPLLADDYVNSLPANFQITKGFAGASLIGSMRGYFSPGRYSVALLVDADITGSGNPADDEYANTFGGPAPIHQIGTTVSPSDLMSMFLAFYSGHAIMWGEYMCNTPADACDVASAIGWVFEVEPGRMGVLDFSIATAPPDAGFYIRQADLSSDVTLAFSSSLTSVPEPASFIFLLTAIGLFLLGASRRRVQKTPMV